MTSIKKTVEKQVQVVDKTICDKCGKEIFDEEDHYVDTYISCSYNYRYFGEADIDYGWRLNDLCLNCMEKLEKLLKDNGYKLEKLG